MFEGHSDRAQEVPRSAGQARRIGAVAVELDELVLREPGRLVQPVDILRDDRADEASRSAQRATALWPRPGVAPA